MSDGAVVVLYDLANNFRLMDMSNFRERANATKLLFDSVTAEKYLMREGAVDERGGMPNIGAFRINEATREHLTDAVGIFSSAWM